MAVEWRPPALRYPGDRRSGARGGGLGFDSAALTSTAKPMWLCVV
jgi:hypothetical protein